MRKGIVMYNGVWWVAKPGQVLCAWLRMFFFRLVVMAAHGLRMVRPSKTDLRGHRLALPPILVFPLLEVFFRHITCFAGRLLVVC